MIKYAECAIDVDSAVTIQPTRVREVEVHIEAQGMANVESTGEKIVITGVTMEEVMAKIEKLVAEGKLVRKE